jgi:outer membrane protein
MRLPSPTLKPVWATLLATGGLLVPLTGSAQSLQALYESARGFDATYQSARAQYDASVFSAEQTRAGLLPSVGLGAGATRTRQDSSINSNDRSFSNQNASINASQPLYRPANVAARAQGERRVEAAVATLQAAEQDLLVRLSQAYFDVLASQDSLAFVRAQKAAVSEQLASAKRNFEVGTTTITDSREAQASFDLVVAQEIAAENDLRIKRLVLDQLVGKTGTEPKPLITPVRLPSLQPADVEAWVQQAQDTHPSIVQSRSALDVARLEVERAEAGHKPTVDLTASYGINRNPSGSTTTGASSRTNTTSVGVNLNWPLFAGFATQNRVRETLSLVQKAESDLQGAQRNVAQATRSAYFNVVSGLGQVQALEAAELSSQSALDANRLGYQVGVRINIDVLNSQSQLFQTKRDLARARYDVLLGGLRLRQANGSLKPTDLQAINALLAP